MNPKPIIAIIDLNTLTCVGLRSIIERMMPMADVRTFSSYAQMVGSGAESFAHYFVSSRIVMAQADFFRAHLHKTFVLTDGGTPGTVLGAFHTLNICQSEEDLVKDILRLQQHAHNGGRHLPEGFVPVRQEPNGLSAREVEVLALIVRGLINKEIADRLHISLSTVISHRKNLMEKLHVRSVSALTIYAVMNGYVKAEAI